MLPTEHVNMVNKLYLNSKYCFELSTRMYHTRIVDKNLRYNALYLADSRIFVDLSGLAL